MRTLELTLHKKQDEAVFSPERFTAFIGGIQSGKTVAGSAWSRIEHDAHKKDDGLIVAPTYKILNQSTLPKFWSLNPDWKRFYKKGDSIIEIPGHGTTYIRSVEDPDAIEGITARWAWLDEAGKMKLGAWTNVQGRLSVLQGRAFISSTPYAQNWLYTDFYHHARVGTPEYKVIQCKSYESPYFSQAEYDRVKTTMDPRTFRRRYDGSFEKMDGLVYDPEPEILPHEEVLKRCINPRDVIAGVDWGFTNQTAIVVIVHARDGNFYIVEEYYESHKLSSEILEWMKTIESRWKVSKWYPDPEDAEKCAAMQRKPYGFNVRKVDKDIKNGIDRVRGYITEKRLFVSRNCPNWNDECTTYHYPTEEDGDLPKELPVKKKDHLMDATRYPLFMYQPSSSANNFEEVFKNRRFHDRTQEIWRT